VRLRLLAPPGGGFPRTIAQATAAADLGKRPGHTPVSGITNKRLRAWMTGLRGIYSMNQASYDLARLRRNGLIERIARTNTYRLTVDGLTFAHGLQPRPRPGPLPPDRARPADRSPRPDPGRLACHHPTYRQARSPPPISDARPEPLPPPTSERFADPRVQALAGCLAIWDFAAPARPLAR